MRTVSEKRRRSRKNPGRGWGMMNAVREYVALAGLQRLARLLLREFLRRELPQLVVDQGQGLLRGVGVTLLDGRQDTGDFAHGVGSRSREGQLVSILPAARCRIRCQAWKSASVFSTNGT